VETRYFNGILVALLSAFLAALFTLANGKLVHNHNPTVISFYELLAGAIFITIYLIFTSKFQPDFFKLPAMDWVYILILASICTAYAFIAAVKVMKHLSPYTIMLTTNLEPVYGIILAFLVLGDSEQMNTGFYYGAALILATVILNGILKNSLKLKRKKALQRPS
ncbi:MAG: DMT family transporter, partial [Leeuwenhoekiella sp.]